MKKIVLLLTAVLFSNIVAFADDTTTPSSMHLSVGLTVSRSPLAMITQLLVATMAPELSR